MEKKYRILGEFIKDISAETKDAESYIYTKENISKFKLFIDINTKPLKNKMAEVDMLKSLGVNFPPKQTTYPVSPSGKCVESDAKRGRPGRATKALENLTLNEQPINQKTPIRVLHRRNNDTRIRVIHK